jgi:hypothetical protein
MNINYEYTEIIITCYFAKVADFISVTVCRRYVVHSVQMSDVFENT